MPVGVNQHGFEECDGILYSVAGETFDSGWQIANDVYAYDPTTDQWTQKTDLPMQVQSPILRAVNGKLYLIGGLDETQAARADVYEYDPDANTWTKKADMPTAREDMGSAVYDGKIYVFGGLGPPSTPTKVLEIYNPATDQWTLGANMPGYKHLGDFGCELNGKIYAVGGQNVMTGYPLLVPENSVYMYDPFADTWASKADIPLSTCYKEVVAFRAKLFVFSGCITNTTTYTNAAYSYDPTRNEWGTAGINAPYAARGIGACVYNGEIYICGGFDGAPVKKLYKVS